MSDFRGPAIQIAFDKFLEYQRKYNLEFFAESQGQGKVRLVMPTSHRLILETIIDSVNPEYQAIRDYANTPNPIEMLMIKSHDFINQSEWPAPDNPAFVLAPTAGYKLFINSIMVRFPENADLTATPLTFTIMKYVPQYGSVVPVVQDTYTSLQALLVQSNSLWSTIAFDNQSIFSGKMIEIKFRYSSDDVDNWSKLSLSSSLGESIICSIGGTGLVVDTNGNPLTDPAYAIFNTKRVKEF